MLKLKRRRTVYNYMVFIFCIGNDDSYIILGHFIYEELVVQPTFKLFIGRFFDFKADIN